MSMEPEQLQALAEAVASWRIEECITLPFYTFYIYYCLTTVHEEVSRILPEKRWPGKVIFAVLRYGTVLQIVLELSRNYRTYARISPLVCKALSIARMTTRNLVAVVADVAIGLCVSALLGARRLCFILIMLVCSVLPVVSFAFLMKGYSLSPAKPISQLDTELGYPCTFVEASSYLTPSSGANLNLLAYMNFVRAILFTVLAFQAIVYGYKTHGGRILRVIGREGGIYYVMAVVNRLAVATLQIPAHNARESQAGARALLILAVFSDFAMPILVQRLFLDIRATDNRAHTLASTFLLDPTPVNDDTGHFENFAASESQMPSDGGWESRV